MQIWDLVNLFMGGLPDEYSFLRIYGVLFVLYIFISMFKLFIDVIKNLFKGW